MVKLLSRFVVGDCGDVRSVKVGLLLILRLALRSVQSHAPVVAPDPVSVDS